MLTINQFLKDCGYRLGYTKNNVPDKSAFNLIKSLNLYAHHFYGYKSIEEYMYYEDINFRNQINNYEGDINGKRL